MQDFFKATEETTEKKDGYGHHSPLYFVAVREPPNDN